jgi:DNA-binding transcriptional ArsR family regulator/uncharacterized protein YndB with AHSA1/START domain
MSSRDDPWRALANPWRRQLLDLLRAGPRTTGALADAIPQLSRYAVMQHLTVLTDADLVVVSRRGRHRYNHLNPVPLRRWYERWVVPLADDSASRLLALQRHVERTGDPTMSPSTRTEAETATETTRTVRIEAELRFRAAPAKVFAALTGNTLAWFPHSYGDELTRRVVIEPRVGGAHYEDWGDGQGYLYGHVTVWHPPHRLGLRGRVGPGSILDTSYEISPDGDETVLRMSKVATGPMTEEEAAGIRRFGDITRFADALRAVIESPRP